MKTLLLLCCSLILLSMVNSNLQNYCLPLPTLGQESHSQTNPVSMQGCPGKIGPAGPPGPVGLTGAPGIPGNCVCNLSEIAEMRNEIQRTKELLDDVNEKGRRLNYYGWCGVGVKDGRIPDSAITASSYNIDGEQAYYGRLDNTGNNRGYWHPAGHDYNGAWLQVDLGTPSRIVGVVTQGRANADQWTTSFKIFYGNTTSSLLSVQNSGSDLIFQGNRDRNSKVTNMFPQPITARHFRLVTVTYQLVPLVRIEYITC